jgi:hypothetical protein
MDPLSEFLARRSQRRTREMLAYDGGEMPPGMFDRLNGEMVKDMLGTASYLERAGEVEVGRMIRQWAIVTEAILDGDLDDVEELAETVRGRLEAAGYDERQIQVSIDALYEDIDEGE